jgi:hypothetical protein
MLRVFSNIRRNFLDEGSGVRYLRYAAGEILLVVIGILIALQIDSWNDDRLDRIKEREYLVAMLSDLDKDQKALDLAIEGNNVLLDRTAQLLSLLSEKPDDPAGRRMLFIHSVAYTYWYLTVELSELTLSQLEYSGGLSLIRDGMVKDSVLQYWQGMNRCKSQYDGLEKYFHVHEARQKKVFNLALGRQLLILFEEDYFNMLKTPDAFEALVSEGPYLVDDDPKLLAAYYGDVLFYRTALNNVVVFISEQKRLAESLASLIRERYDLQ